MKKCSKCGESKAKACFSKNTIAKDGLSRYCKECSKGSSLKWKKDNPERLKESQRRCLLRRKYNISIEDYDRILSIQGGGCAICGIDTPFGTGRFAVDHDHVTSKVRGLLCAKCNIGIGQFNDDPSTMLKAMKYLEFHGGLTLG